MKSWCSTQGQRSCPWGGTAKRWGRYRHITMPMAFLTLSNTTVIRSTGETYINMIHLCHMSHERFLFKHWDVRVYALKLYNMCAATLCFHSWPWCLRSVNWLRAHHVTPAPCQMHLIIPAWRVTATSARLNRSTKTSRPSPNRWMEALTANRIPCTSISNRHQYICLCF